MGKKGRQSVVFENGVYINGRYSMLAGQREHDSKYSSFADLVLDEDTLGENTFEKTERMLCKTSVLGAINTRKMQREDIDFLIGGDLLDQIITTSFAAREIQIPFLGIYGACSTIAQSILTGGMLVDGGFAENIVCCATSHFATAERQFRQPLEMGTPKTPTSQVTVNGSGACIVSKCKSNSKLYGGTVGKIVDLGIKDASNMGAAMAPACADTLLCNFKDFNIDADYYDKIITGDLGKLGSSILYDILKSNGVDIEDKHFDCGSNIFKGEKDIMCGASGCGCAASMLCGYVLKSVEAGGFKKILFIATGAMMSKTTGLQGESIPGIAHAITIKGEYA